MEGPCGEWSKVPHLCVIEPSPLEEVRNRYKPSGNNQPEESSLSLLQGAQEGIPWALLSFTFCYSCSLMLFKDLLPQWFLSLLELQTPLRIWLKPWILSRKTHISHFSYSFKGFIDTLLNPVTDPSRYIDIKLRSAPDCPVCGLQY